MIKVILLIIIFVVIGFSAGSSRYAASRYRSRYFNSANPYDEASPHSGYSSPDHDRDGHEYPGSSHPNEYDDPCRETGPQFPNYIPPMKKLDLFRTLGKWYTYLEWRGNAAADGAHFQLNYNTMMYLKNLTALTLEPSTNKKAYVVEELFSSVQRSDRTCRDSAAIGYLTEDGAYKATVFDNYQTNAPNRLNYQSTPAEPLIASSPVLILSTDYDTYIVLYLCYAYNTASGFCSSPIVTVLTRSRPDSLTSYETLYIAGVVNGLLGKYCFEVAMMTRGTWLPQLPACPFLRPSDNCYNNLLYGMLYLAGEDNASDP
ncbi:uncharacterized protein LOC129591137 [Paramacrobiotus metropolitanus]|uniref:uncharacterized protein LOC129591137 n=1 Tax=Paramacrobiotus metropolitanus TaxID=2943436 RepID=UPI0024458AA0|nr:uncharacterized protein LOC129591137 [Paramacrobiotus metropolitanus]